MTTSAQKVSPAHWMRSIEMILASFKAKALLASGSGSEHRRHYLEANPSVVN